VYGGGSALMRERVDLYVRRWWHFDKRERERAEYMVCVL
jgi:hypothetical protein